MKVEIAPALAVETGSASHVVELRDVGMRLGNKQVLDGISLVVDPQERLVIIGQSGVGKTMILRLILGMACRRSRGNISEWTLNSLWLH